MIELKNHKNSVREHDILSTAIDTPEHTGRVRGVSSSRGWKQAFGKEHEGLWKKKKWSSVVDPNRLKQEIKDDIFATLRAAGIDVEAALLAAASGKSSCASKEVEQRVPEEAAAVAAAALPNPPGQCSVPNPGPPSPSIAPMFDEPDTNERFNNVPTPCSIITGSYSTLLIELAQGIVQPGDKECHTVLVQDGYVVVKLDFVHENTKDVALPIPLWI